MSAKSGICSRHSSAGGRQAQRAPLHSSRSPRRRCRHHLHAASSHRWDPDRRVRVEGQHPAQQALLALADLEAGSLQARVPGAGVLLRCRGGCPAHQTMACPAPTQQPRTGLTRHHVLTFNPAARPSLGRGRSQRQPQVGPPARLLPRPPTCSCCTCQPCDLGSRGPSRPAALQVGSLARLWPVPLEKRDRAHVQGGRASDWNPNRESASAVAAGDRSDDASSGPCCFTRRLQGCNKVQGAMAQPGGAGRRAMGILGLPEETHLLIAEG